MAVNIQAPKGTQDVLPSEAYKWQTIEKVFREEAEIHGFSEIRTPVFEHTELFVRGVGDASDIVQKEMYTFLDKGGRSITLRPEGTAGAVRAVMEHALYNETLPVKLYYFTSCYRYEKPQAGRLREFHQFGLEMFGTPSPAADAEVICFVDSVFRRLGIKGISLEINSVGCPECRKKYYEELRSYFEDKKEELCETCLERLGRNPMRIFDCKSERCKKAAENAPRITEHLCDSCKEHFERTKGFLDAAGIKFTVNPLIVRGLDYYTNTVFEFVSGDLGAQSTVCGGGRYNGLAEEIGNKSIPGLGFAIGLERLLLIMQAQNIELPSKPLPEIYIASIGQNANQSAFYLKGRLQECGIYAECDISDRSLKAQMKYADKIGAKYTMVLGDDEVVSGIATIKDMKTGKQKEINIKDDFIAKFAEISVNGIE